MTAIDDCKVYSTIEQSRHIAAPRPAPRLARSQPLRLRSHFAAAYSLTLLCPIVSPSASVSYRSSSSFIPFSRADDGGDSEAAAAATVIAS